MPNFNIKGSDSVNSRLGGLCTLVLTVVTLAFAVVKFEQMWKHHNPIMSTYEKDIDPDTVVNLTEDKFRIAFSVADYKKPKNLKNDPEFVRWHFRLKGEKDGEGYEKVLPYRKCTEEDYAEFYPIEPK